MAKKSNNKKQNKRVVKKTAKKVSKKMAPVKAKSSGKKVVTKAVKKMAKRPMKKAVMKKAAKSAPKTTVKAPAKKPASKSAPTPKLSAKRKDAPKSAVSMLGQTVPAFSVLNSKGETLTDNSLKGHKAVLYFYPKDDTPGCTLEGQQFSNLVGEFLDADTVVFGVSKDSPESHDKFICKYNFKIDLISDTDEQLCKIFDVIKEKNMYGKKFMGIERSTFVLDADLKVVKEIRKVSPDGHAQEILEFVKSL